MQARWGWNKVGKPSLGAPSPKKGKPRYPSCPLSLSRLHRLLEWFPSQRQCILCRSCCASHGSAHRPPAPTRSWVPAGSLGHLGQTWAQLRALWYRKNMKQCAGARHANPEWRQSAVLNCPLLPLGPWDRNKSGPNSGTSPRHKCPCWPFSTSLTHTPRVCIPQLSLPLLLHQTVYVFISLFSVISTGVLCKALGSGS